MDVVWLKRDARLCDHQPLAVAAAGGQKFVVLFIYEPDQLSHETVHGSHVAFLNEGLLDVDRRLSMLAGRSNCITLKRGEAVEVFSSLHASLGIGRILSHEETGHGVSYARDIRIAQWCRSNGIQWLQLPQSTVVRGLSPNSDWNETWKVHLESFLQGDVQEEPFGGRATEVLQRLVCHESVGFLCPEQLSLPKHHAPDRPHRQCGGECHALELLRSFIEERAERYSGSISSPISAWTACSRLSPYIAWGHVSIRTVWQAAEGRLLTAKGKWAQSVKAFIVRLQWRCVYCQRFEMRCWMEHTSMCKAWEKLRRGRTVLYGDVALLGSRTEEERLAAFEQGRTGYPFVDACMRCLLETGWLNFRMRCMLVSFAIYNLWFDWRAIAGHMARCFLDFEPGIHYPQLQMQAATTGIDMRCYNVTKQAKDQDPKGDFIRRYVKELSSIPDGTVLEPWKLKQTAAVATAAGYPQRIVDELKTAKASKTVIVAMQKEIASARAVKAEHLTAPLSAAVDSLLPSGEESPGHKNQKAIHGEEEARLPSNVVSKRRKRSDNQEQQITFASFLSKGTQAPTSTHLEPWACPRCTLWNDVRHGSSSAPSRCQACEGPPPPHSQSSLPSSTIELD